MGTTTTLTGVNANTAYRITDVGGLRSAVLEPTGHPPALLAETAAPRLVVVTRGEYSNYQIDGVVELAAGAPGIDALRELFASYIRNDPRPRRASEEAALVDWLVKCGYARRVEAAEWNFEVLQWGQEPPKVLAFNEFTCPRDGSQ